MNTVSSYPLFSGFPGSFLEKILVTYSFQPDLEDFVQHLSYTYCGIPLDDKKPRKYGTLFAAKVGKRDEKIVYDPVAIKIDQEAFLYKETFMMLNTEKVGGPPKWPKLR